MGASTRGDHASASAKVTLCAPIASDAITPATPRCPSLSCHADVVAATHVPTTFSSKARHRTRAEQGAAVAAIVRMPLMAPDPSRRSCALTSPPYTLCRPTRRPAHPGARPHPHGTDRCGHLPSDYKSRTPALPLLTTRSLHLSITAPHPGAEPGSPPSPSLARSSAALSLLRTLDFVHPSPNHGHR